MGRPPLRATRADDGAVTIIVSLALMALLFALAISVDINALRSDVRDEQATSDFAALAAGQVLSPSAGYDPEAACQVAWDYAVANLEGAPNGLPSPCSAFTSMTTCSAVTAPVAASASAGPYVITITTPVPDGHPLMQGRLDVDVDGWSCERLGVSVAREREHIVGGVAGSRGATTETSAVVRAFAIGQIGEFASLIVLDRTGCNVLLAKGQGAVVVDEFVDTVTGDVTPGIIAVDSRGTTCANNEDFAIDATGAQNSRICVGYLNPPLGDPRHQSGTPVGHCVPNGTLFSYGVAVGFGPGIASHDPCDIGGAACNPSGVPRLAPPPVAGTLVTRVPGDHRYNCKATYPVGVAPQDPADPIDPCDDAATTSAHIDALVGALGGTGVPSAGLTWNVFPDPVAFPGVPCAPNGAPLVFPAGNWWIDCPASGPNPGFRPAVDVTFVDPGYIVVRDGIEVRSGGSLTVGSPTSADAVLFLRDGDLVFSAQSAVDLRQTFTYLHLGTIDSGAGSPVRRFIAPSEGADACTAYGGAPPAACFEDLILWSNSTARHTMAGQGVLDLQGVFFTPNARPFELKGDSTQTLDRAQFISARISLTGQGVITMRPNPEYNLAADLTGGGLIR